MTEHSPKVFKLKSIPPISIQLTPFWPKNIESWFCYAEADFCMHGITDSRTRFLAVVKALPREFNKYVTPSMFTSDVPEPYETLKLSILKRGDLTDRQRLDKLLNNIDLQQGSATDMLLRMREVIGQRTFDDGLFRQLFLSKLPQQVQAVLVSFQNNAIDELAASADRILEITKFSKAEVFPSKKNPNQPRLTWPNYVTRLQDILEFVMTVVGQNPHVGAFHVRDLSLDHERQTTPTGAGITTGTVNPLEIAGSPAIIRPQNRVTRKTVRETSQPARVNGNRSRRTQPSVIRHRCDYESSLPRRHQRRS
ncbi:hypothetical protein Smp_185890 [Schistosoma mansoni]|uniref:hypothetical protein n=1 Tax=Schistosoma mansoni TaxID=6183 RepID=UPI00022DBF08|nr:hypothetical protein Smp_185890 [Schistosoma mansoni]|eukprot:XP_018651205.1 hypothetical protein Smp_185890 [Schistosoma mansoni]